MRKLIQFFVRHSSVFIYLCYAALCLILLFGFNPYQQSVYFSSASRVAGSLYSLSGAITGYFGLQKANNELLAQNGKLQNELAVLRNTLARYQAEDSLSRISVPAVTGDTTNMIIARVINNSIARKNNYITIDKGNRDGVFPEMGLVDQNGVVGVVSSASSGYAVALSLLNPNLRISCKVKNTHYIGSLVVGQLLATADVLAQSVGIHAARTDDAQRSCIGAGGGKLAGGDVGHAALNDGVFCA